MNKERWKVIPEFPYYEISNLGRVYNTREDLIMRTSHTTQGHVKITLVAEDKCRYTRSVAQMVAEAFVEPPTPFSCQVLPLDGNIDNLTSENLVWRPTWFAWKYVRQLKVPQPNHYYNLKVYNVTKDIHYKNIIEAGMIEGCLFADIWRSTFRGAEIFPGDQVFTITGKSMR